MKTLRQINNIAYYTTLLLFITFYLGIVAEILLGIIQVASAILLTYKTYQKLAYAKKQLIIYWILAIIAILMMYYVTKSYYMSDNMIISLFTYIIFPMGVATYFKIICNKITFDYENA